MPVAGGAAERRQAAEAALEQVAQYAAQQGSTRYPAEVRNTHMEELDRRGPGMPHFSLTDEQRLQAAAAAAQRVTARAGELRRRGEITGENERFVRDTLAGVAGGGGYTFRLIATVAATNGANQDAAERTVRDFATRVTDDLARFIEEVGTLQGTIAVERA